LITDAKCTIKDDFVSTEEAQLKNPPSFAGAAGLSASVDPPKDLDRGTRASMAAAIQDPRLVQRQRPHRANPQYRVLASGLVLITRHCDGTSRFN